MSFSERIRREHSLSPFLIHAPFPDGRKAWYFILVSRFKINSFCKVVVSKGTNLREYGEILRSGWGEYPPAYIIEEMKKEYGYING